MRFANLQSMNETITLRSDETIVNFVPSQVCPWPGERISNQAFRHTTATGNSIAFSDLMLDPSLNAHIFIAMTRF